MQQQLPRSNIDWGSCFSALPLRTGSQPFRMFEQTMLTLFRSLPFPFLFFKQRMTHTQRVISALSAWTSKYEPSSWTGRLSSSRLWVPGTGTGLSLFSDPVPGPPVSAGAYLDVFRNWVKGIFWSGMHCNNNVCLICFVAIWLDLVSLQRHQALEMDSVVLLNEEVAFGYFNFNQSKPTLTYSFFHIMCG